MTTARLALRAVNSLPLGLTFDQLMLCAQNLADLNMRGATQHAREQFLMLAVLIYGTPPVLPLTPEEVAAILVDIPSTPPRFLKLF